MQNYTGIPASSLPDTKAPDFTPRLKNMLSTIDFFLRDASAGFGRIENGQAPSGSGAPISVTSHHALSDLTTFDDHSQYLYLPGRSTQRVEDIVSVQSLIFGFPDLFTYTTLSYSSGTKIIETQSLSSEGFFIRPKAALILKPSTFAASNPQELWVGSGYNASPSTSIGANFRMWPNDSSAMTLLELRSRPTSGGVDNTGNFITCRNPGDNATLAQIDSSGSFSGIVAGSFGKSVVSGATTSAAGVLGKSDLTAQTGSIGAVTLLTGGASTAGMYRVSVYMVTTTAGTALDVVKATVAWNDGAAQTLDVPLLTTAGAATNLDLATLNAKAQGSVIVYAAASQNITYTTTVTKTGTPQYAIHVRIEALG